MAADWTPCGICVDSVSNKSEKQRPKALKIAASCKLIFLHTGKLKLSRAEFSSFSVSLTKVLWAIDCQSIFSYVICLFARFSCPLFLLSLSPSLFLFLWQLSQRFLMSASVFKHFVCFCRCAFIYFVAHTHTHMQRTSVSMCVCASVSRRQWSAFEAHLMHVQHAVLFRCIVNDCSGRHAGACVDAVR